MKQKQKWLLGNHFFSVDKAGIRNFKYIFLNYPKTFIPVHVPVTCACWNFYFSFIEFESSTVLLQSRLMKKKCIPKFMILYIYNVDIYNQFHQALCSDCQSIKNWMLDHPVNILSSMDKYVISLWRHLTISELEWLWLFWNFYSYCIIYIGLFYWWGKAKYVLIWDSGNMPLLDPLILNSACGLRQHFSPRGPTLQLLPSSRVNKCIILQYLFNFPIKVQFLWYLLNELYFISLQYYQNVTFYKYFTIQIENCHVFFLFLFIHLLFFFICSITHESQAT